MNLNKLPAPSRILILFVVLSVYLVFTLIRFPERGEGITALPLKSFSGVLTAVHDGDTVSIRTGGSAERVRLIGIDAPELGQKPWGSRARDHLKKLLGNGAVRVSTDMEQRDQYGRILGYVWSSDGRMMNIEMLRDGYAVLYTVPTNVQHVESLQAAQSEARQARRGIWGKGGLRETPSRFRKEHPRR